MRKIFICYRRAEAEYAAGALGRDLRRYFGEAQVFRDKEDIGGGIAWRQHVLASIDGSSALLVLISRDWVNARDEKGTRRLDDPYDPVRTEILDGGRDGAAILPVLLEEASMPRASELPVDLRRLAELNALRLRDGDWHADLDRICKTLEKVGFVASERHDRAPKHRGMPIKLMVSYLLGAFALLALIVSEEFNAHRGAAIVGFVGLLFAARSYQEYRQGKSNFLWLSLAGIALGIGVTSINAAFGVEPTPSPIPTATAVAPAPPLVQQARAEPPRPTPPPVAPSAEEQVPPVGRGGKSSRSALAPPVRIRVQSGEPLGGQP